jgi:hypothetical protein
MLNIDVNRSAKGVEQYFDCELAVSDYLMKEPGIWAGRGAERLGLRGPVQRSHFVALNPGIVHFEHIYHCAHELISTFAPTAGTADGFRPSRRIAENLRV